MMTDAQRIAHLEQVVRNKDARLDKQRAMLDSAEDLARMVLRLDLATDGGDFQVPVDLWAKMVALAKKAVEAK